MKSSAIQRTEGQELRSRKQSIYYSLKESGIKHTAFRGVEFAVLCIPVIRKLYWSVIPQLYNHIYNDDLREYPASPNPFDIISVDPNNIRRFTGRGNVSEGIITDVGRVVDGDWDKQTASSDDYGGLYRSAYISETDIYDAIGQRINNDIDWDETTFYKKAVEAVKSGETISHGYESVDDIKKRCETIDQLIQAIRENGYLPQNRLRKDRPSLTSNNGFGFFNERTNEICVDIGRDGELLLVDGRHRVAISRHLDLNQVPVLVISRHEKWMARRSRILKEGLYSEHPDVNYN